MPSTRRLRPSGATALTVAATALQLFSANPSRTGLIITEYGGKPVRIGSSDVVAAYGLYLAGSTTTILEGGACPTGEVWIIRATGDSATVSAAEVF